VDDVFVDLVDGRPVQRPSLLGQVHALTQTTRVVEFNDLAGLQAALAPGDVACVLAEPVMTNIGMVLPEPGFWPAAADLIRRHGSLLVLDETHTISSGPGGYARAHGLAPDALVLGKPLGGGMPCAAYGFTAELAARCEAAKRAAPPGHSGIGTTLTANLLAMAAMRATLSSLMTDAVYQPMLALAGQLADGLRGAIARHGLPWCVSQVGARAEFQFCARPPRNGSEAAAAMDDALEHLLHLALLNRGVLITPFHNMMLVCPETTPADVDRLVEAFDAVLAELTHA
jgi:glutamate-1-semialdehyde 2,1-aminomutase